MTTPLVQVHQQPEATVVSLNRPAKRNALNSEMIDQLDAAISTAFARTVPMILRSATPGMFAAGADLATLRERSLQESIGRRAAGVFQRLADGEVAVIAAVDGPALGGGCELALACDIRVTSPTAHWGLPEVTLGLIPSAGGLTRLTELVGLGHAKDLVLTGRTITGEVAAAMGLAQRICDSHAVDDEALRTARRIADNFPTAVRLAKEVMGSPSDRNRLVDALAQAALIRTDDVQTRIGRFLDRASQA